MYAKTRKIVPQQELHYKVQYPEFYTDTKASEGVRSIRHNPPP